MRIAYVCADPGVPVFGRKGCSVHVQEVIRAFRGLGMEVDLFAARCDGDPPPDLATVRVHKLPAPPKGALADREQASLGANHDLRAALNCAGSFDLVYERYSLWSFAGMEYARAAGVQGILEVNAPLIEEQIEYRGLVDRASAERVAQSVFGAAAAVVAVSREIGAYVERYPAARGRVHVVPNGVNAELFRLNREPSCPGCPGTFTVGFVGSLKPWHGLPILVKAFALLQRLERATRLLVVGDGPERASLVANLAEYGLLESVHFTGAVAPSEVPGLLTSMDVAVAPYANQQQCYFSPLKVYEYMAAGLPVVASRIGQLVELIQDGINGLLCPPGDPVALAGALNRLRLQPALSARLRQAARSTVLEHHTWEVVARRILDLAGLKPVSESHLLGVRG